jgi:hypothetical protein
MAQHLAQAVDDGQAESEARLIVLVAAETFKLTEDDAQLFLGNAKATVMDSDAETAALVPHPHQHTTPAGIFDGV